MQYDWLIVGAGFTGCVLAERIASQLGETVLIVDRRDHLGGNAHDAYDEHGVLVHRYGAHLFHTNDAGIWRYLSRFTAWRPHEHKVVAEIAGQLVPVPFNLNSLRALFPARDAGDLERRLTERYGRNARVPILTLRRDYDTEIARLAEYIYQNVFLGYTVKQWGMPPEELDPSVTARVPVVLGVDDRYFQDTYQGMPAEGYTAMFRRMIDLPQIELALGVEYRTLPAGIRFNRMIYTGPIDEYFDRLHGALPYRSLRLELTHHAMQDFQRHAVINYPNCHAHTRTLEFKHMTGQQVSGTTVMTEYPLPHHPGTTVPYYPIPRRENAEIHARYQGEVKRLRGTTLFAGRLADYRYYNMDQATGRALSVFYKVIAPGVNAQAATA